MIMISNRITLKEIFGENANEANRIISEDKVVDIYDIDGIEYCVFMKNDNNKFENIIKYQLEDIDRRFIMIYKDYRELFHDNLEKSEIYKELNISKNVMKQTGNYIKVNGTTIFTTGNEVTFHLEEEGANYLTYEDTGNARGDVLSISIRDLIKLYNVQGNNLYKRNIREGLVQKGEKNNLLYDSFKAQFMTEFIRYLKSIKYREKDINKVKDDLIKIFQISKRQLEEYNNFDLTIENENFWFKHNGITIVADSERSVKHELSVITFKAKEVQVVNGAQTISRWFELRERAIMHFKDKILTSYIDEFLGVLKVKVTIIKPVNQKFNNPNFTNQVTIGLNTQTPILESDIFVKSSVDVERLRETLNKEGVEIINIGKLANRKTYFTLKEIIQLYYCSIELPGTARNLAINKISDNNLIEEINMFLKENKDENLFSFCNFLSLQHQIEDVWKEEKVKFKKGEITADFAADKDKFLGFLSNGLMYFKSYLFATVEFEALVVENDINELLKSRLFDFEKKFYRVVEENKINVDSNIFKKDDTFQKVVSPNFIDKNMELNGMEESIKKINEWYSNENDSKNAHIDKSWKSNGVKNILKEIGFKIDNMRTITFKDNTVTEAFSFPSATFIDLANKAVSTVDEKELDFENSEFKKQISKTYNLLVFMPETMQVKHLPFNFDEYKEDAKQVYTNTLKELQENIDDYVFIGEKDDCSFHIRPHGKNGEDRITLADDSEVMKNTFWANKKTMNKIISNNLK